MPYTLGRAQLISPKSYVKQLLPTVLLPLIQTHSFAEGLNFHRSLRMVRPESTVGIQTVTAENPEVAATVNPARSALTTPGSVFREQVFQVCRTLLAGTGYKL